MQPTQPEEAPSGPSSAQVAGRAAYRNLALYLLVRLALVAAVAGVLLLFDVPLLIALAVGVVLGFPLAMVLFRGLGHRVAEGLAAKGAAREAERERLRAQLRGESPTDPAD